MANITSGVRGNPYHDAEGKFTSKDGMRSAISELRQKVIELSANPVENFTQIAELSTQFSAMKKEYEGYSGEDYETGKPVEHGISESIIAEAKELAQRTSNPTLILNENNLVEQVVLNESPTWEPAGVTRNKVGGQGFHMEGNKLAAFREKYAAKTGSSSGYIPPKAIAAQVREDIQEAIKGGYLPRELEYGVQVKDANSWSPSVEVLVKGLSNKAIYSEEGRNFEPAETRELKDRVRNIVDQYKYSHSDGFDNYFSNVGSTVVLENENMRKNRLERNASAKRVAKQKTERAEWLRTIDTSRPLAVERSFEDTFSAGIGTLGVVQVQGTKYYLLYRKQEDGSKKVVRGYDFSGDNDNLTPAQEDDFLQRLLKFRSTPLVKKAQFDLPDSLKGINL